MVETINAMEVAPHEVLSNTVYHYDAASKTLEKARTFEKRMEREAGKDERSDSVLGRLKANKEKSSREDAARYTSGRSMEKRKNTLVR